VRLFGGFAHVFADLMLIATEIRPFALHGRLQPHAIGGASHSEDRNDYDEDYGQNSHSWPMYHRSAQLRAWSVRESRATSHYEQCCREALPIELAIVISSQIRSVFEAYFDKSDRKVV